MRRADENRIIDRFEQFRLADSRRPWESGIEPSPDLTAVPIDEVAERFAALERSLSITKKECRRMAAALHQQKKTARLLILAAAIVGAAAAAGLLRLGGPGRRPPRRRPLSPRPDTVRPYTFPGCHAASSRGQWGIEASRSPRPSRAEPLVPPNDPLGGFLPPVSAWFLEAFGRATPPQEQGWPAIASGRHTLIFAPTGSGKTLAAFLACLDHLWRTPRTAKGARILYISPLKALNQDVSRNLQHPLEGILATAEAMGAPSGR